LRKDVFLILLTNAFNMLDIITTLYALYFLEGFKEANTVVRCLLEIHPLAFVSYKIGSVFIISAILLKSRDSEKFVSVYIGTLLGLIIMCVTFATASVLNIVAIAGYDVRKILKIIATVNPALKLT